MADCSGCGVDSGKRKGTGRQQRVKTDVVAWWVANKARVS